MLDQMRSAAKSWVAKFFLGLLGLSFLVWGVPSSFLPQIGKSDLLTSGASSVGLNDYAFVLRDTLVRWGADRVPPISELRQSGILAITLARLQQDVLLDEEARRMQLGADEEAAVTTLRRDSSFQKEGTFNRDLFSNYLENGNFNQAEVLQRSREAAKRAQVQNTITAGISAPDMFYQATLLYERESRAIDYLRLDSELIADVAPPSDEVLATWFDEQVTQFRAPEYRTFTYMPLNAGMLVTITDEQVQDYYQANKERFATSPEFRTFEQLRFDNRELADAAYAKLQSGTSFEELVREQGQDLADITQGPLTRGQVPVLMASEIFAPKQGEVSEVINDLAGPVIVRITHVTPAQVPELSELEEALRAELAFAQAGDALRQKEKEIEDAHFEGATLAELAAQYNLPLITLTLDATGFPQAGSMDELPNSMGLRDNLLAHVFAGQPGIDQEPLLGRGEYIWYQVDKIIAARRLELSERYNEAQEFWVAQETTRQFLEKAATLKAEAEAGKSLEQIAQENGIGVERAAGLQRATPSPVPADIDKSVIDAVFATPFSSTAKAINMVELKDQRDVVILFQVTDSAEPLSIDPQSLDERRRQAITEQFTQDLSGQFLSQAQRDHAIMQNQQLLEDLFSDNSPILMR